MIELVAGLARLGDAQQSAAHAQQIPNANVGLIEDAGYDVLAETAGHEAIRDIGELGSPSVVVVQRILQDRLIRSPVDHRLCLFVALQAKGVDPDWSIASALVDGGSDSGAA